jgi:hypothetical protein
LAKIAVIRFLNCFVRCDSLAIYSEQVLRFSEHLEPERTKYKETESDVTDPRNIQK